MSGLMPLGEHQENSGFFLKLLIVVDWGYPHTI
jgi:hypothetical protein